MNKKGFTLVEIIVCVTIISVIGVVIGLNSDKMFKKEEVEPAPTKIESAAAVYAEGNRGLVEDLYNEKTNFIDLSVGELIDNGLIDESVLGEDFEKPDGTPDTITRDTNIVVTLNADGDLNFDFGSETDYGYLRADDIVIAAGDPYGCDYSIANTNTTSGSQLIFSDSSGDRITTMTKVDSEENVTADNTYWCNIDSKRNSENKLDPSTTYEITYVYKIEGLKSRKTRSVTVLDPLVVDLKKDDFKISTNNQNDFILKKDGSTYKIYYKKNTSNITFKLNKITTNYTDKIQMAYKLNSLAMKTHDNLIGSNVNLNNGNNKLEVYPTYKHTNNYSTSQIENDTAIRITPATVTNITISDAPITINSVVYKDSSGTTETITTTSQSATSKTGKKVTVNATSDLSITSIKYKLDGDSSWQTLNSNTLITTPSKKISIQVTNEVGEVKEATYNFNVYMSVSNFNDNKCTTATGKSGCYYKGSQSNNYVKLGGKIWRIYKKVDNSLYLILNSSYITTGYGLIGNCTSGCCNGGRYYYQNLASTTTTKTPSSYGFAYKTMNYVLDDFYNSITTADTSLLTSISQTITNDSNRSTTISRTNGISLLEKDDYSIIASCSTSGSCGYGTTNYIKSGNSAFWLLETSSYVTVGSGTYNYGNNLAKTNNYIVNSTGKIEAIVSSNSPQGVKTISTNTYDTRPIAKIISTAKIISGNGTSTKPYELGK